MRWAGKYIHESGCLVVQASTHVADDDDELAAILGLLQVK